MSESLLTSWQTYVNTIGIGLLVFLMSALVIQFLPLPSVPSQTPTIMGILAAIVYLIITESKRRAGLTQS